MRRGGLLWIRDERGVSAAIAVVSLLGLFAAALLSLDFGNMWSTRRMIISGTDGTALDQAIFAAKTGATDCNRVGDDDYDTDYQNWTNILSINTHGYVPNSEKCEFHEVNAGGIIGYVSVEAQKEAANRFGALFGLGNSKPYSFSAARVYYPDSVEGLRPIGICIGNEHVQEWLDYQDGAMSESDYMDLANNPPDYPIYEGADYPVHRIKYNKESNEDPCGEANGNWGFQDYDGPDSGNSNDQFKEQMIDGYDGQVNAPGDCNNDGSPDGCPGDPGEGAANDNGTCGDSSLANALECVRSIPGTPPTIHEFGIVIFDTATCNTGPGGGDTCSYNVVRYVGVRLWGWKLVGDQQDRYFDFEFVPWIATGPCCATNPNQTDVKAVQICAVDHDTSLTLTEAQRCNS
jgi:hypothetical protein